MVEIGTPYTETAKRALLLGSGELGKELVIELSRLGVEVTACDRYSHAPAMQVAHHARVFDMLNAGELRRAVLETKPHLIIPEVEAICTPELQRLEDEGWAVVPTARATRLTMDREGIRRGRSRPPHGALHFCRHTCAICRRMQTARLSVRR